MGQLVGDPAGMPPTRRLDADLFEDEAMLSGPEYWGYFVAIDTPDGYVKIRRATGQEAVDAARRWAADRGIELRIHRVTGDYTP